MRRMARRQTRHRFPAVFAAVAVYAGFCAVAPAHAGLIIDPTFDPSLSAADDAAIQGAILEIESAITSPNDLTVSIYYTSMSSGLGESTSTVYDPSYYQYYSAFSAVATSPLQQTALASLGTAPTGDNSGNPVNGSAFMQISSAEARNLGFNASGILTPDSNIDDVTGGGTYDGEVALNTSIAVPPSQLGANPDDYSIESVANHETDEILGIGGEGSTLDGCVFDNDCIGDLDLYRYSAPGVRSYSDEQTTSPYAYFSVDSGDDVVSYFNQTEGADYGDWLSNPIPAGFDPQVQDAFGTPGTDPQLGPSEITAFAAIGYEVITPEPSTVVLTALGLVLGCGLLRRRLAVQTFRTTI